MRVGSLEEAENYLDWVHRVLETVPGPERLHPLYTLAGGPLPPEAVIDSLPGYAGSRPVRVATRRTSRCSSTSSARSST